MKRTPLKRTRLVRKPRRGDRPDVRAEWAASQIQRCAVCWAPGRKDRSTGGILQLHHMLGGARRIDDARNFLLLCFKWNDGACRCHDLFHGERIRRNDGEYWPQLTLGHLLGVKRECDPQNFDLDWLQEISGRRRLPDIEPLPDAFLKERMRWEPLAQVA